MVLLNVCGYFDALHQFISHGIAVGFVSEATRGKYAVAPDVPACLAALKSAFSKTAASV